MSNKIKIKNEVPELLEAVCIHKDCPEWLKEAIWEAFNNQNIKATFTADYWRGQFDGMFERKSENESNELGTLASQLSAVMKNDLMPTELFNVMADALSETPEDWRTPEAILINLKELKKQESKS
ncbi:MAG: hypothetical protein M3388_08355 [Acidobacteriota bacterium]|nr:hypothetical protein [Acidobacteriota bacterium]